MTTSLDGLRTLAARTEALGHALETMFDGTVWPADRQDLERLAHLVGATAEAAAAVVTAIDRLQGVVCDGVPLLSGETPEDWGGK